MLSPWICLTCVPLRRLRTSIVSEVSPRSAVVGATGGGGVGALRCKCGETLRALACDGVAAPDVPNAESDDSDDAIETSESTIGAAAFSLAQGDRVLIERAATWVSPSHVRARRRAGRASGGPSS